MANDNGEVVTSAKPSVGAYGYLTLLGHKNVITVQRNHPDEFIAALRDVEVIKGKTGLPFTSDEQRRLAALAVLQSKGMFPESTEALRAQFPTTTKRKSRKKSKEAQPA
jgi:hypothetical protein